MVDALIDPPSDFAPIEEWREFLEGMLLMDQSDPDVLRYVRMAEDAIKERENGR